MQLIPEHYEDEDDEDTPGPPRIFARQQSLTMRSGTGEMIAKMDMSISSICELPLNGSKVSIPRITTTPALPPWIPTPGPPKFGNWRVTAAKIQK